MDENFRRELVRKYQWAGKIRFVSFLLLFLFLVSMKLAGGYAYLNTFLVSLLFVEAILNQPYGFFLKKVNLYRFQFYQMIVDIIIISWVVYCMGGIDAQVVSIAYFAVILWAGVVSGPAAVFFAVSASSLLLSFVVIFEHFGLLPPVSYLDYRIPTVQMLILLFGNVAFLFAFGYFSARSSSLIRFFQRKRQEESLRYTHRLSTTGYLVGKTAHDIQGCLAGIRGSVQVLLSLGKQSNEEKKFLESIEDFEKRGASLIHRLAEFSQKPTKEFVPVDINSIIEKALELTEPLVKYSKMAVEKKFEQNLPLIAADKDQMQEVFVVIILNALDAVSGKPKGGQLSIRTTCLEEAGLVEIIFSDTGIGLKPDELRRIGEPFFSAKKAAGGSGLGLATAYDIVARHSGRIDVKSREGEGATFIIRLPFIKSDKIA